VFKKKQNKSINLSANYNQCLQKRVFGSVELRKNGKHLWQFQRLEDEEVLRVRPSPVGPGAMCAHVCREEKSRWLTVDALLQVTTVAFRFLRHSHAREATCTRSLRRFINRYIRGSRSPTRRADTIDSRTEFLTELPPGLRVSDRCPGGSLSLVTTIATRLLIRNEIIQGVSRMGCSHECSCDCVSFRHDYLCT